jgi:hypothetical protein
VLADVRKGVIEGYRTKARSGIWDAVVADAGTLLVASSDCRVVKMGLTGVTESINKVMFCIDLYSLGIIGIR